MTREFEHIATYPLFLGCKHKANKSRDVSIELRAWNRDDILKTQEKQGFLTGVNIAKSPKMGPDASPKR